MADGLLRVCFSGKAVLITAIMFSFVCAGCASVEKRFDPAKIEDASGIRLLRVKHVRQKRRWDCGESALCMVLNTWGDEVTQDELREELGRSKGQAGGVVAYDLKECAQARGFDVFILPLTLEEILEQVAKGRPLIVAKKVFMGVHHYEVVCGYDEVKKRLLIDNPASGKYWIGFSDFRERHEKVKRFTFLAARGAGENIKEKTGDEG